MLLLQRFVLSQIAKRPLFGVTVNRSGTAGVCRALHRSLSFKARNKALSILGLKTFSDSEIEESFTRLKDGQEDHKGDTVNVQAGMMHTAKTDKKFQGMDAETLARSISLVTGSLNADNSSATGERGRQRLSFATYKAKVIELGEQLDPRVWNIGLSFIFTGTSVGILVPCMPLLVSQLGLSSSVFGLVISSFGLSKLLGNIPSGYLVERYGRKPIMVAGLAMCGLGLGSIGLALLPSFGSPWLIACRFVSGLGVSAFVAGGFMFVTDISTPLNRTRTFAPVMAGFSGGAALGPAIGGVLIDNIGISQTYATVGALFLTLATLNSIFLSETKEFTKLTSEESNDNVQNQVVQQRKRHYSSDIGVGNNQINHDKAKHSTLRIGISDSFRVAFKSWRELLSDDQSDPLVRHTALLNGLAWFTLSGTQMTLLPLYMVGPQIGATSAYEIGGFFAFMSVVSFLAAQPSAFLADRYGKVPNIVGGCGLMGAAMAAMPLTNSIETLLPVLLPLALGSTVLNSTPTALMADLVTKSSRDDSASGGEEGKRAQGLSLLRTTGDMGLLLGAATSGLVASVTTIETALFMNGAFTAGTVIWYAAMNRELLSPANLKSPSAPKDLKNN